MRRTFLLVLALMLLVVPLVSVQAQEPLRIGIVTDLSGWLSFYGVEQVNGFKLGLVYAAGIDPTEYETIDDAVAAVTIAGRPVEIIIGDYGSENAAADADNAANVTREMIESQFVDILFGTPNSGAALQVQTLTSPAEYDLLFMAGPAASPILTGATFNENTFRVCRNSNQDAFALASQMDQFGDSYVVLAVDTAFGTGTAAAFETAFAAVGATKAADTILVPSDTVDFTPYLQQVLDSGADVVVQAWAGAGGITLAQQTVELGVLDRMKLVTGTNSNDIVAVAPPEVGTVSYIVYQYTLPDTEINDWMTEKHIAMFNDVPDLFTECSFATAQALYAGLEATGGDPLPAAMIPALEGLTWQGPKGEYFIRPSDHQTLASVYVVSFLGVEEVEIADGVTMMLPQFELVAEATGPDAAPPCELVGDYAARCSE
jgi:branched-chain amino acid transport system substrate-binding protein